MHRLIALLPLSSVFSLSSFVFCLLSLTFCLSSIAQKKNPDDVEIRVVDVGNGLCCAISIPGDHYIIYDAGTNSDKGRSAMSGIRQVIPRGKLIDLLVLSHPDNEHLGAADSIILKYQPKKVIRTGYIGNPKKDSTNALKDLAAALRTQPDVEDMNLNKQGNIKAGMEMKVGEATVTFLSGFGKPESSWGLKGEELLNALSIVMKLEYKGKSVLFCGDATGWAEKLKDDQVAIATEQWILDNNPDDRIKSDVVIASQGGSLNGNSLLFIRKAKPDYVIFSAGTGKGRAEPRYVIVDRYIKVGTPEGHLFRTDRGDGFDYYPKPNVKPKHWNKWGVENCMDKKRDDDVRIILSASGAAKVSYYKFNDPCR